MLNNGMNYGPQGNTAKYGFEMRGSDKPALELPPQSSQPSLKLTLNPDTFNTKSSSTTVIKNEFMKKPLGNVNTEGRGLVLPPANDALPENKRNPTEGNPRFFNQNNNMQGNNENAAGNSMNSANSRDFSKLGLPASSKLDEFMAKKNEELSQKNSEDSLTSSKMKSPAMNSSKVKGLEKVEELQPEDMKNYPQTTKVRTLRNLRGSEDANTNQEESEYLKMKTVSGPSKPERRKSPGTGERKNPPPIVKPTTLTKADILIASSDEEEEGDDNSENQELFQCPEGCGRKFGKKGLKKHVKVCKKIFQSKRETFDSSQARTVAPETKASSKENSRGKKETQSVDTKDLKKKGGIAIEIDMGNSKKKAKWKQDSDAFRAVVKVGKDTGKKEEQPQAKPPVNNNAKKPPRK